MAAVAAAAAAAPSFSSVAAPHRAPCALFARSCLCPSAAAVARSLPRCSISSQLTRSGPFTPWSGLKCLAVTLRRDLSSKERKEKCRGKVVYASLFGVGAPEVLVIGVVALLVFGPKGLAEVARTLGKTLRAFQPTIKELQDVSKEFKSTLEREIGLDEISSSTNYINKSALYADQNQQAAIDPNGKPSGQSYTSEELFKVTEDQLAASVASSEVKEPKPETAVTSDAAEPASGKQLQASTVEASTSTVEASTKSETGESAPKDEAQVPSSDTTENQR